MVKKTSGPAFDMEPKEEKWALNRIYEAVRGLWVHYSGGNYPDWIAHQVSPAEEKKKVAQGLSVLLFHIQRFCRVYDLDFQKCLGAADQVFAEFEEMRQTFVEKRGKQA